MNMYLCICMSVSKCMHECLCVWVCMSMCVSVCLYMHTGVLLCILEYIFRPAYRGQVSTLVVILQATSILLLGSKSLKGIWNLWSSRGWLAIPRDHCCLSSTGLQRIHCRCVLHMGTGNRISSSCTCTITSPALLDLLDFPQTLWSIDYPLSSKVGPCFGKILPAWIIGGQSKPNDNQKTETCPQSSTDCLWHILIKDKRSSFAQTKCA